MADEKTKDTADADLRAAIAQVFQQNWRLRRLLDFTRPYRMQPRAFQRMLPRARRESVADILRTIAAAVNDETIFGPCVSLIAHANKVAPHRGHSFKLPRDFVASVQAWRETLSFKGPRRPQGASVRTHTIADGARRSAVTTKKAIEAFLQNLHGRHPTPREVATAQAVYSQRTRRSRST